MGQLAAITTTFPGIVYGPDGRAVDPMRPCLSQVLIDVAPVRRFVAAGDLHDDESDIPDRHGRCWLLNIGARWEDVPRAERFAALSLLRCGHALLLLAAEPDDEASVRAGLLNLLFEDSTPMGRFGHA